MEGKDINKYKGSEISVMEKILILRYRMKHQQGKVLTKELGCAVTEVSIWLARGSVPEKYKQRFVELSDGLIQMSDFDAIPQVRPGRPRKQEVEEFVI